MRTEAAAIAVPTLGDAVVRAVMCDVDGTLLTSDHTCTPATIEAVRAVRERGVLFGLSTGRDALGTAAVLDEWGLSGLIDVIVGSGGSEVLDVASGSLELSFPLAGDAIREIISHYEDLPVSFAMPYRGVIYTTTDDERIRRLSRVDGLPFEVVDLDEFLAEPRPKVMIVCEPEVMDDVVARAATFSSDSYRSASLITAARLYEYMDPRVSKPRGIARAGEMYGFALDEVCAFGDADNDAAMVAEVGMGVVMANGSERTRSAARYTTASNDEDGVAAFIATYLL